MWKRISLFVVTLSLVGCTPVSDPVLEQILGADFQNLQPVQKEVSGYCFPTEFFCSNPLFEPAFSAPATVEPAEICREVIDIQSQIGLVAFSTAGGFAEKVSNQNSLQNICEESLIQAVENFDGSISYPGTVLFDDGLRDGVGKVTVISRNENGSYFVVFSISRNLGRVGPIPFE